MCFNARFRLEIALKRARRKNSQTDIDHWKRELEDYDELFQVSGFAHPKIVIYTNNTPYKPQLSTWGLIPDGAEKTENIWNKTLNARGETIFEKPSFIQSAREKRCLIPAEGFYEHHHFKGKIYPFYISRKNNKPLVFAGLRNEWINPRTDEILNSCSIVTTKANLLMSKIHNNPKFSGDARMPVILPENLENDWLQPLNRDELQDLLRPFSDSELVAHTVKRLSGKNSPGNVFDANKEFKYEELEFEGGNQFALF